MHVSSPSFDASLLNRWATGKWGYLYLTSSKTVSFCASFLGKYGKLFTKTAKIKEIVVVIFRANQEDIKTLSPETRAHLSNKVCKHLKKTSPSKLPHMQNLLDVEALPPIPSFFSFLGRFFSCFQPQETFHAIDRKEYLRKIEEKNISSSFPSKLCEEEEFMRQALEKNKEWAIKHISPTLLKNEAFLLANLPLLGVEALSFYVLTKDEFLKKAFKSLKDPGHQINLIHRVLKTTNPSPDFYNHLPFLLCFIKEANHSADFDTTLKKWLQSSTSLRSSSSFRETVLDTIAQGYDDHFIQEHLPVAFNPLLSKKDLCNNPEFMGLVFKRVDPLKALYFFLSECPKIKNDRTFILTMGFSVALAGSPFAVAAKLSVILEESIDFLAQDKYTVLIEWLKKEALRSEILGYPLLKKHPHFLLLAIPLLQEKEVLNFLKGFKRNPSLFQDTSFLLAACVALKDPWKETLLELAAKENPSLFQTTDFFMQILKGSFSLSFIKKAASCLSKKCKEDEAFITELARSTLCTPLIFLLEEKENPLRDNGGLIAYIQRKNPLAAFLCSNTSEKGAHFFKDALTFLKNNKNLLNGAVDLFPLFHSQESSEAFETLHYVKRLSEEHPEIARAWLISKEKTPPEWLQKDERECISLLKTFPLKIRGLLCLFLREDLVKNSLDVQRFILDTLIEEATPSEMPYSFLTSIQRSSPSVTFFKTLQTALFSSSLEDLFTKHLSYIFLCLIGKFGPPNTPERRNFFISNIISLLEVDSEKEKSLEIAFQEMLKK